MYCIGGTLPPCIAFDTCYGSPATYFTSLSNSGIGGWTETSSYPIGIISPACATSNGYIYCVGGSLSYKIDFGGPFLNNPTANVYYAKLSSSGIGSWQQTTGYPVEATGGSCQISGGYIYCVDGAVQTGTTTSSTNAGFGSVFGSSSTTTGPRWSPAVFYAQVSSAGVGPWREARPYPYITGEYFPPPPMEFNMICVTN
jgi:hypothetical protein